MARITVTVEPRRPNNSPCEQAVKPSGKHRDPASGCPSRTAFAVVCSEHLRVLAEPVGLGGTDAV
ncbi:hypothetical protein [Streptomyces sp. NEAU-YJ-81]|uniref:hypothetical protein n=1 Tax=Streptomyces sp. NEAU-YJ-81 TaxID=2820288 RepID=UPI001ABD0944|nr:hypothetical protein [Streptomyces sp. NEAU-YJ-81]MBO3675714.1 hypothetical protein [Streptomyces sp. NEAU-YJ-81]